MLNFVPVLQHHGARDQSYQKNGFSPIRTFWYEFQKKKKRF